MVKSTFAKKAHAVSSNRAGALLNLLVLRFLASAEQRHQTVGETMWGKDSQQHLCDKSDFFHYTVASHTVHSCGAGPGATCITLLPPSSWWPLEMGQVLPKACLRYPCHPTTPTPLPVVGSTGPASAAPGHGRQRTAPALLCTLGPAALCLQSSQGRVLPSSSSGRFPLLTTDDLAICYQQPAASPASQGAVLAGCC